MTVQEAIEKLKYIKYIGNGEQEYKKCSESIAIDIAIEALEKQIKLEEVVAMLEGLKSLFDENNYQLRYERFCKPKKDVCVGRNCFACIIDEVIEKVKERM